MKLNRRQFLKFTGTALVASALPLSTLASLLTETPKAPPAFILHDVKKGDYVFSFCLKNDPRCMWFRYVRHLSVIDDMDITILMPTTEKAGILKDIRLYPENPITDPVEVKITLLNHSVVYDDSHRQ